MGNWLKKAPPGVVIAVIVVCGAGFIATLGAFVVLEINGADTADFRAFVNTLANLIMLPLVGVGTVAATAAARSASNAEDQTNGMLMAKDDELRSQDRTISTLQNHLRAAADDAAERRDG